MISPTEPQRALEAALRSVRPFDEGAAADTRAHLDQLTKPPGSLGRLEELALDLAGITGNPAWRPERRTITVFAADHGVAVQGVSAYPQAVTGQMVRNFLSDGAAINVLARGARAEVLVVDVGVASVVDVPGVLPPGIRYLSRRVGAATADMTAGPAMPRGDALAAIAVGLEVAGDEASRGTSVLALGEMGIANSTAASAIVASMTGMPANDVTGPGTGVDTAGRSRKVRAVERALSVNQPDPGDPLGILAGVGGYEIAALAGAMLGAAAARMPVVLDGFITGAAALVADGLARAAGTIRPHLLAGHRSSEPGHRVALEHLGLRPLLDLDLRLGEGTGAALALHLLDAACSIRDEMATFESARVDGPAVNSRPGS